MARDLRGQNVVVSGRMPGMGVRRPHSEEGSEGCMTYVQQRGGITAGNVSGMTTLLVLLDDPGYRKLEAARRRGKRVVTWDQLVEHINGGTDMFTLPHPFVFTGNFSYGNNRNGVAQQAATTPAMLFYVRTGQTAAPLPWQLQWAVKGGPFQPPPPPPPIPAPLGITAAQCPCVPTRAQLVEIIENDPTVCNYDEAWPIWRDAHDTHGCPHAG